MYHTLKVCYCYRSGFEKPAPDSYWSRKARQSPVPSEVSTSIRASPSSPQARARKSSLHPPVDPELGDSPKVRKILINKWVTLGGYWSLGCGVFKVLYFVYILPFVKVLICPRVFL